MSIRHDLNYVSEEAAAVNPQVLIITADLCFYSSVLYSLTRNGWRSYWARTLDMALPLCHSAATPIIIYDQNLPGPDWHRAFYDIRSVTTGARLILAADSVDEQLWKDVLYRGGYDVMHRCAASDDLRRNIRFAWLSMMPCHTADSSREELLTSAK